MADQQDSVNRLASDIVVAFVTHNRASTEEVKQLLADTLMLLRRTAALDFGGIAREFGSAVTANQAEPDSPRSIARPTSDEIEASISYTHLRSFENGKLYRTLRRHLGARGLTPALYRKKWGLPDDYPMTAQEYSESRAEVTAKTARENPRWRVRGKARVK